MPRIFVSIGSNIDREQNIRGAIAALKSEFGPLRLSSVYETEPQGFHGENFYNLVSEFSSAASRDEIGAKLAEIERRHGRGRGGARFSARTLDLDLLLYGDAIIHEDGTDIPRREIGRYAFVLRPLAEIAPDLRHPETGETFAEMWARFPGKGQQVRRIPFDPTGSRPTR